MAEPYMPVNLQPRHDTKFGWQQNKIRKGMPGNDGLPYWIYNSHLTQRSESIPYESVNYIGKRLITPLPEPYLRYRPRFTDAVSMSTQKVPSKLIIHTTPITPQFQL